MPRRITAYARGIWRIAGARRVDGSEGYEVLVKMCEDFETRRGLPCGIPRTQRDNTAPSGVVKQAPCFASNTRQQCGHALGPPVVRGWAGRPGGYGTATRSAAGSDFSRWRIPSTLRHSEPDLAFDGWALSRGGRVLDHPAADKAPFGQAVRARSAEGGGWLGWVIAVDDLARFEVRMGAASDRGQSTSSGRNGADLAPARREGSSG